MNKKRNKVKSQRSSNTQRKVVREQPKKDSDDKRVNYDNMRKGKIKDIIERDSHKPDANDISWYSRNPELLKAAGSIPFGSVLGDHVSAQIPQRVPGLMVLNWQPAYSSNPLAINQSFNAQYSFVVHANSRNYSYTAPDLGMLEMAGMDVFNIIATMQWAFGVAKFYEYERNMYYPQALLQARGFQPKTIRNQLSQMWFDINNLINQTKQIWVPNIMPIADRWFWLNSNYFTDAPGTTTQTYLFNQESYYILSEKAMSTGTSLIQVTIDGAPYSGSSDTPFNPNFHNTYDWSVWVKVAQGMIDALIQSEDRGIIFGDILNAYGAEKIRALPNIPSDYVLGPVFNAEVLMQIENSAWTGANIMGFAQENDQIVTCWDTYPLKSWGWSNDENAELELIHWVNGSDPNGVLNFHFPTQPTPEQIVVATRARSVGYKANDPTQYKFDFSTKAPVKGNVKTVACSEFCSELYHSCEIVKVAPRINGGTAEYKAIPIPAQLFTPDTIKEEGTSINQWILEHIQVFDWHPFIQIAAASIARPDPNVEGAASTVTPTRLVGDYDNYTGFGYDGLHKLNMMAIFSLLGIPQIV